MPRRRWCRRPAALAAQAVRAVVLLTASVAAGFAALVLALPALAQAHATDALARLAQPHFQQLTQTQGLPNDIVTRLAEDGDGFLWVATLSGLSRWDGYRFRVYRADARTPGALPDNFVQALRADATGRLWVGTSGAGLARYDRAADRFVVYTAGPQGLSHVSVLAVADDGAGGVWVGTAAGLDHVDPASGAVQQLGGRTPGLPAVRVGALLRDRSGALWAGTTAGLLRRAAGQQAFVTVPLVASVPLVPLVVPALKSPAAAEQVIRPEPVSLLQDSGGRIWVGTAQHGTFVVLPDGSAAAPVPETDDALPPGTPPLALTQVSTLLEVKPGEVWMGTVGHGVVVAHWPQPAMTASLVGAPALVPPALQTRRLRNVPTLPSSLAGDSVADLWRDRSGLVWVAHSRGISRHDPNLAVLTLFGLPDTPGTATSTRQGSATATPGASSADVSWLLPMPDGSLWLGTHNLGVRIIEANGTARAAPALQPDPARPGATLPIGSVLAMDRTADGSVLIGSKRGLYRATGDGRTLAHVPLRGRDAHASTWALLAVGPAGDTSANAAAADAAVVDNNTLWLGGQFDGLWRVDLRSNVATALMASGSAQPLTDQRISVLARGSRGTLWVGTRNGLNHVDPATGTLVRITAQPGRADGLPVGYVSALLLDARGRLWVGTYGGGIAVLDTNAGLDHPHFRRIGTAEGLPDDNVNALVQDASGRIWASTDNGLADINPDTGGVRALRRAEGVLFPTYWTGSAARTARGDLLFGGAGGITLVQPALLRPWAFQPPVVVTDVRVGGAATSVLSSTAATPGKPAVPTVTLPPGVHALAVEFAALDYSAPDRNRYAHRLDGFDKDWISGDAAHRSASYTNLPPGDYTLRLRGSNRDGIWTDADTLLTVHVQSAWFQTLWFHVLAALVGIGLLVGVVQLRTRWLRLRRDELERKVGERTAALEAMSLVLQEKSRVLELSAVSDPLTGLRNRRFLAQHIDSEIAASQRRALDQAGGAAPAGPVDTDTVFLLIDLDHFKRVNDAHGHAAGDAALVQFGRRLQQVLRESDHLVRWGGEEFLAVARDTDRARAEELAERIRSVVADAPFELANAAAGGQPLRLRLTCSIGVAALPFVPAQPRALGWQDVVQLADLALFTAKRLGRNSWVAVHATSTADAQPPDLLARLLAEPLALVQRGEVRMASNRDAGDVLQALQGRDHVAGVAAS